MDGHMSFFLPEKVFTASTKCLQIWICLDYFVIVLVFSCVSVSKWVGKTFGFHKAQAHYQRGISHCM
jgi:hypothetical protein